MKGEWGWACKGRLDNGRPCPAKGSKLQTRLDARAALKRHWESSHPFYAGPKGELQVKGKKW